MVGYYLMFVYLFFISVIIDVNVILDMYNMIYGEISQVGFLGEDFNDVISLRFDGGDSVFLKNVMI